MNIEFRIDCARGFRTHVIRGETNMFEIRNILGTLYASEGFDPEIHALWDMREADFSAVTPIEIRETAYFARVNWAEKHLRKTALVISGDLHFGLCRMFEQFIGPSAHGKIKTFRDLQTAIVWLEESGASVPPSAQG